MISFQERQTAQELPEENVESASVTLIDWMHFKGVIDQHHIDLDAAPEVGGTGSGPQPLRLLLLGVAGCTAMDVLSILRKKRQQVTGLDVKVVGKRADDHPRVYTALELVYHVNGTTIDPQAVARAIELSETRYCSAIAMLRSIARITSRFEITEEVR